MKRPKISIIVPIYNVERFLEKCIESIVNQTYTNLEIILVDDASPDRCNQMIDEAAVKDSRIMVIHQYNKWLGGARNSGIKFATGDYILFVDPDDYIRFDMCEKLMEYIKINDVDLVIFDTQHVDGQYNLKDISSPPIEPNYIYQGDDVQRILYPLTISSHCVNSAWMKLYKTFIHDEKLPLFDEQIRYAEDYEYCLRLFPKLNSFTHYDEAFYYYVVNDESIMNKPDSQIMEKMIVLYHFRERFLFENHIDSEKYKLDSAMLLSCMIVKNLPKFLNGQSKEMRHRALYELCQNKDVREALSRISILTSPLGWYGRVILFTLKYRMPIMTWMVYSLRR